MHCDELFTSVCCEKENSKVSLILNGKWKTSLENEERLHEEQIRREIWMI